jgi:hypothetical protein
MDSQSSVDDLQQQMQELAVAAGGHASKADLSEDCSRRCIWLITGKAARIPPPPP